MSEDEGGGLCLNSPGVVIQVKFQSNCRGASKGKNYL